MTGSFEGSPFGSEPLLSDEPDEAWLCNHIHMPFHECRATYNIRGSREKMLANVKVTAYYRTVRGAAIRN